MSDNELILNLINENKQLRELLKPFVDAAIVYSHYSDTNSDDFALWSYRKSFNCGDDLARIMRSDFLRCLKVLK